MKSPEDDMRLAARKIPSLDGLRAVSILLVLLSHFVAHMGDGGALHNALRAIAQNGPAGVSVFFVISGFLITMLLDRERQGTGRISLKGFYTRRIFRIVPAYLAFLAAVAILVSMSLLTVSSWQFARALTFTMDYELKRNWYLGHTWSLSVEEQFYLVWPLLMCLCRRRTLVLIATGVIVLEPVVRLLTYAIDPKTRPLIIYMAHTRADMISFGCLAALMLDSELMDRFITRFVNWRWAAIGGFFLLIPSPWLDYRLKGSYQFLLGYTLQGVCITIVMLYLVLRPRTPAGRLFNSRLMVHLGLISYSLYLWQELFLGAVPQPVGRRIAGIILTLFAAEASYHLVEQPMLRMRSRLTRTRAHVEEAAAVVT